MNQQQRLVLLALLAPSLLAAQTPLWDMDGHPDTRAIYAVAFNNDGSKVISGSECDDARVRLWNSTDGTMLWDGQISSSLFCIAGVQFSASGSYFGAMEELGTLLVYDYSSATPVLVHTIPVGVSAAYSLAFSPDNTRVAADGAGGTVRVYDLATGTLALSIPGNNGTVYAVNYLPDGNLIAAASSDNKVRLWNASTGALVNTLTGHTAAVRSVKFSAAGDHLVSGASNGQVKVWHRMGNMWMQHASFNSPNGLRQVDISDDNELVIVGGSTQTYLYRAMTGELLATFNVASGSIVWSVDFKPGSYDAITGTQSGRVVYWALQTFLSVEEREAITFSTWPNPTTDGITVQLDRAPMNGVAEVFTIDGRLVLTERLSAQTQRIALDALAAGDYVLRVRADGRFGVRSINKQ